MAVSTKCFPVRRRCRHPVILRRLSCEIRWWMANRPWASGRRCTAHARPALTVARRWLPRPRCCCPHGKQLRLCVASQHLQRPCGAGCWGRCRPTCFGTTSARLAGCPYAAVLQRLSVWIGAGWTCHFLTTALHGADELRWFLSCAPCTAWRMSLTAVRRRALAQHGFVRKRQVTQYWHAVVERCQARRDYGIWEVGHNLSRRDQTTSVDLPDGGVER